MNIIKLNNVPTVFLIFPLFPGAVQLGNINLSRGGEAHRNRCDQVGDLAPGIDADRSQRADILADHRQIDHRI